MDFIRAWIKLSKLKNNEVLPWLSSQNLKYSPSYLSDPSAVVLKREGAQ